MNDFQEPCSKDTIAKDSSLVPLQKSWQEEKNANGWGKINMKNIPLRYPSKEVNFVEASIFMVCIAFVTFFIALSLTVIQVGLVSWILLFILMALLIGYSVHLMTESCMLEEYKGEKNILPSLMKVSKQAKGKILSSIVMATLYANLTVATVGILILTSTILSEIVSMPDISNNSRVRIWTVVSVVLISPLVQIGFYKDLRQSAFISLASSLLVLFGGLGVSIYVFLNWNLPEIEQEKIIQPLIDNYFRAAGTIFFSMSGLSLVAPEIIALLEKPKKMFSSTNSIYCLLGLVYSTYCILMHLTYGMYYQPSTTATLNNALELMGDSTRTEVCVIIIRLCMCMNFLLAIVLFVNPIFTQVERSLNIRPEYNWKRFVIRTIGLLLFIVICVILPHVQPVISLAGGTLLVLSTVIYPIIIYALLQELTLIKKGLLLAMVLVTSIIIIGNFVTGTRDIYFTHVLRTK